MLLENLTHQHFAFGAVDPLEQFEVVSIYAVDGTTLLNNLGLILFSPVASSACPFPLGIL